MRTLSWPMQVLLRAFKPLEMRAAKPLFPFPRDILGYPQQDLSGTHRATRIYNIERAQFGTKPDFPLTKPAAGVISVLKERRSKWLELLQGAYWW